MRKLLLSFGVLAGLAGVATAQESAATDDATFTYAGVEYTVHERCLNADGISDFTTGYYNRNKESWLPQFFFVYNDKMYTTNDGYDNAGHLVAFDPATGEVIDKEMTITWTDVVHNGRPVAYAGVDSEGNPYVASFGAGWLDSYPFEIYPIEFDTNGKPQVMNKYSLLLDKGWCNQSPDVFGNVKDGNFKVATVVWDKLFDWDVTTSNLVVWTVEKGTASKCNNYNMALTNTAIKFIDENTLVLHDSHQFKGQTNASE